MGEKYTSTEPLTDKSFTNPDHLTNRYFHGITLFYCSIIISQIHFIKDKPLGIITDQVLRISWLDNSSNYQALKEKLLKHLIFCMYVMESISQTLAHH